jgi:hypothetical protein
MHEFDAEPDAAAEARQNSCRHQQWQRHTLLAAALPASLTAMPQAGLNRRLRSVPCPPDKRSCALTSANDLCCVLLLHAVSHGVLQVNMIMVRCWS